ncbi:MAG: hypothetical protein JSW06_09255 [Thermoplasmatales archaeon]|nr:MAG: hypothetical protein JSW06_09255 [Thermoplasmatales archaeon]
MKYKKIKIEAVALTVLLLGAMFLVPASSVEKTVEEKPLVETYRSFDDKPDNKVVNHGPIELDRKYIVNPGPAPLDRGDNYNDAGMREDAGDSFTRSDAIYPGELVDNTPGRGVTGELDSSDEDWYFFSVCIGQDIDITMTPPGTSDFDLALWDETETLKETSSNVGNGVAEFIFFTAEYTGFYYMQITYASGSSGQYSFDVNLSDQNDANTGDDAGDTFANAVLITPDTYSGYLDMDDPYDWYKFVVDTGDGIHFNLEMEDTAELSDYDISLYNEAEELVHYEKNYYDDELLYPVPTLASPEEWRVKIEIFPGWVDAPEPTEWKYYNYGSGAYNLEFAIDGSAPAPPDPIPQPQITPMTKTFTVNNDPDSNNDEYGYIASIPACNYLEGSDRYLAPIVYDGDDTSTNYFDTEDYRGVVDDTTGYLLEDWNDYLTSHGETATEYIVPADPIEAAADIATNNWVSSDLAVVAVDGSGYEDEVKQVFQKTKTLRRAADVTEIYSDDPDIGDFGYSTLIFPKWCAFMVKVYDITIETHYSIGSILTQVFPKFMDQAFDDWPTPYDAPGDSVGLYYPITQMGIWSTGTEVGPTSYDSMEITKIAGHRHRIRIGAADADSVLKVTVETDTESDLQVFLVDPKGHIRAPDIPQWTGPVNPIHVWNGCSFDPSAGGFDPWRSWEPEDHLVCSAEVLHPEPGRWTAIVVPRYEDEGSTKYTITAELRKINPKRADAAVSAANAAVIASQEHAPLLYVTEDSIPSETQSAFTTLGVTKVIFVERGGIGSSVSGLPTLEADLTTMQEIIDHIKGYSSSENYITITSIKSGDGYFAPAAMLAAYHGSPVLRIGDAPGNPAGVADRIETWRIWAGTWYHGSRAPGHLPRYEEPIEISNLKLFIELIKTFIGGTGEITSDELGLDAHKRWFEELYDGIHDWIAGYGLDLSGQEGYCFVAPRKDIYIPAQFVMTGTNSYGGHIPGLTPAYISAVIVRSVLYPALIFANENRNFTTTNLQETGDGAFWTGNDGVVYYVYTTRDAKKAFSSHGRTYEGHCVWEAHLERMNNGASAYFYDGHGTGGSGQGHQYIQTPFCNYPEQIWWDAWRGYTYDNWDMPRRNGNCWHNPEPPNLYDIIHYDHVDGNYGNLGSCAVFYHSCSTADQFGPMVFLDHGAVSFFGDAGSGPFPGPDIVVDKSIIDALIYGEPIGQAYSKYIWIIIRDFTTDDPTSMYGSSSMDQDSLKCIYGDPNLIIYSPEWTSPVPVDV